ncbi:MAG: alpha/beta hydrolase [Alphaproteobacteria bacterium]|nr:alpha/beta hydrolase [Alphaproteobacteria bacterium]
MTEYVQAPDGLKIAFEDIGQGEPIVLVHGFGSDRLQNWRGPGWYDTLLAAGRRVIALDIRGHGQSDKPYDPALYAQERRVSDVLAVMDAAGVARAVVMGYSMGGYMTIHLAKEFGSRVERLIVGGVGETYFHDRQNTLSGVADALEAEDPATIVDPVGLMFRRFADQKGKDRMALAACMRGTRITWPPSQLAEISQKALVVCGGADTLTGRPGPLAAAFRRGRSITIERRDHMTAVGDKLYKQAVVEFLQEQD